LSCAAATWAYASVEAATVDVTASGVSFTPANVAINAGDSVHWIGLAGGFHNVAEVDDATDTTYNGGFRAPAGANEFTHQFNVAGTYYYICEPHVHSGMRGTVTVNAIPAASEWGLVVLALLVLSAGTIVIARSRRMARA
jgi:plastocyanin